MPVTKPVAEITATPVAVEFHAPDAAGSLSETAPPAQIVEAPEIEPATGNGFTVTARVAVAVPQLFVTVKLIVDVPVYIPKTLPVVPTVATAVVPELHTPPAAGSLSNVPAPEHTTAVPRIDPASGMGLIVTTWVVAIMPQPFITV